MANDILQTNIDGQYGVKYTKVLHRMLQQDSSLVTPYFTVMGGCVGKSVEIPYNGMAAMKERTQRAEPITNRSELQFGNRHMRPRHFLNVSQFSHDDKMFNTNIDFSVSNIITEVRAAINRTRDEVLMGVVYNEADRCYRKLTVAEASKNLYTGIGGGLLATNYTGLDGTGLEDLSDTDTGNDLTTNVVPFDFKYSGTKTATGAVLDKIVRGIELLKKRQAYKKGVNTCVLALTARQLAEIQMWEQSQNKNYGFGDLVNGYQNRILGINILETEMLPFAKVGESQTEARICPMWVKEDAIYGVWDDVKVRIDSNLQDFVDLGQVVTTCSLGASRKYKEAVVQLQCVESIAS